MLAVFGLGNPGKKYEYTRHNAGFCTVDYIAAKHGIKINKIGFNSLYGEGTVYGEKLLIVGKTDEFLRSEAIPVKKAVIARQRDRGDQDSHKEDQPRKQK